MPRGASAGRRGAIPSLAARWAFPVALAVTVLPVLAAIVLRIIR